MRIFLYTAAVVILWALASGCRHEAVPAAKPQTPELARDVVQQAMAARTAVVDAIDTAKGLTPANVPTQKPVLLNQLGTADKATDAVVTAATATEAAAVADSKVIAKQADRIDDLEAQDVVRSRIGWLAIACWVGAGLLFALHWFWLKLPWADEAGAVVGGVGLFFYALYLWGRTLALVGVCGAAVVLVVWLFLKYKSEIKLPAKVAKVMGTGK
jgi:hypothetical protein